MAQNGITDMVELYRVSHETVKDVWSDISGYVDKAIVRQKPQLIDSEYLYSVCRDNEAMLLIAKEGLEIIGFSIIKCEFWPLAKTCFVMVAAGKKGNKWIKKMHEKIEEIALLNQCKYVIGLGRKGWARATPSYLIGNEQFYREVA